MKLYFDENKEFIENAIGAIKKVDTVLDIGCGIRPQPYIKSITHICCEPFDEYVNYLCSNFPQKLIINSDWEGILKILPQKSVDTVFLIDVIEHLDKEIGIRLLEKTKKLARCQIIVFTPLGFLPQHHEDGIDAWGLNGGEWQEHKSGWTPEDFSEEWDFYISNNYHNIIDPITNQLNTYGALWCILNVNDETSRISELGYVSDILNEIEPQYGADFCKVIESGGNSGIIELVPFLQKNYANSRWGLILSFSSVLDELTKSGKVINCFDDFIKQFQHIVIKNTTQSIKGKIKKLLFNAKDRKMKE